MWHPHEILSYGQEAKAFIIQLAESVIMAITFRFHCAIRDKTLVAISDAAVLGNSKISIMSIRGVPSGPIEWAVITTNSPIN